MRMYTIDRVNLRKMLGEGRQLTDRHQEHKANGVEGDRLIGANFLLVEPEEGGIVSDETTKCSPTQVCGSEEENANQVQSDSLHHVLLARDMHVLVATYIWTSDAVENKDLDNHDQCSERIQGQNDEGPEPSFSKDVGDCMMVSN